MICVTVSVLPVNWKIKRSEKHFNRIFGDLLVSVDKAFTELSEAIKKED